MRFRPRWPASLAGRFTLLLVLALLAANVAAVALLAADRARVQRAISDAREFNTVLDAIRVISAAPADEREDLARTLSNPFLRIRIDETPAVTRTPRRHRVAERRIAYATGLDRRVIAVGSRPSPPPRRGRRGERDHDLDDDDDRREWARRRALSHNDGRPGPRRALWISVTLGGDEYLNIVQDAPGPLPNAPFAGPFLLIVVLSLLTVLGVGLLFVRKLTRPIRGLAEAARRAGRGDYTTRVPETGARELREMAIAFNDMQARIARFDQDRMRLIAAVGHDLRTPITSLRIRAEMLDDEMREPMVRTLDEMHVMADGLLAFARGEAAETSETLDLADLARRVCAEAEVPFDAKTSATVLGRPVALSRMLSNLITNAERYAEGTEVNLTAADGRRALLTVADRGPGIPPDRLDDMMQPFTRLDASRSTETGGAGLGLSIARSIARAHGGDLTLANREVGGLTATIELPLATRDPR